MSTISGSHWEFLEGVKNSGVPIPRSVLVKRIQQNVNLLAAMCKVVKSSIKLASVDGVRGKSATTVGAGKILSFFTACIIELAQDAPLNDSQMRQIYPLIIDGFRCTSKSFESHSSNTSGDVMMSLHWLKSSCMILAQISRKTKFSQTLIQSFMSVLSKAFVHSATTNASGDVERETGGLEIAMTLAVLAQQQKILFENHILNALFFDAADQLEIMRSRKESTFYFLETLRAVHKQFEASDLIIAIASGLGDVLIGHSDIKMNAERAVLSSMSSSAASALLCSVISSGLLRDAGLRTLVEKLIGFHNKQNTAEETENLFEVLRKIAQRYPNLFDNSIDSLIQTTIRLDGTTVHEQAIRTFLGKAFIEAPYHIPFGDGGTSLLLSLRNTSATVRIEALQSFASIVPLHNESSRDVVGLAEAAVHCMVDQNFEVATVAWSAPVISRIAKFVENSLLIESSSVAITWWTEMSMRDTERGCTMLCNIFAGLSETLVISALIGRKEMTADSIRSKEWLLNAVISHALGLVVAIAPNGNLNGLCKNVERAAFECAVKSKEYVPLFKQLKGDQNASALNALGNSISKNFHDDFIVLRQLTHRAHLSLNQGRSVIDKRSTQSFVQLLDNVLLNLAIERKSLSDINDILALLCPLLVRMIGSSMGSSAECSASLQFAIDIYSNLLENIKRIDGISAERVLLNNNSVSDLVEHLYRSSRVFDFRVETLRALLVFTNPAVAPLVFKCISVFFPSMALCVLLQIAFNIPSQISSDGSIFHSYLNDLNVSFPQASTGALYAISTLIRSDDSIELDSCEMIVLLLIVAASCCDQDEQVRCGGLAIAKRMTKLSKHMSISAALIMFGKIMSNSSASIAMDGSAAQALLGSELFSKRNDECLVALQNLLLDVIAVGAWYKPSFIAPVMSSMQAASLDFTIKHISKIVSSSTSPHALTASYPMPISRAIVACFNSMNSTKSTTQEEVSILICNLISSEAHGSAQIALQEDIFDLISTGWAGNIRSDSHKKAVFESLIQEQMRLPGRENVLSAINQMSPASTTLVSMVQNMSLEFNASFKSILHSEDQNKDVLEEIEVTGMSVLLQRMCSLIEAISPSIKSLGADGMQHATALGLIVMNLMDLFMYTSNPRLRAVISIEYCNTILMDLVQSCISIDGISIVEIPSKRSGKDSSNKTPKYSKTRVLDDIKRVLNYLSLARSTSVQTSALNLIEGLVSLDSSAIETCINCLGEFLASTTLYEGFGKDEILKNILRTLVNVVSLASAVEGGCRNHEISMSQEVLQPLCFNLRSMPSHRRSSLLKMVLSTLTDSALPISICVLLTHVFCAYGADLMDMPANSDKESQILLSRSAQRRAFRSMKTTQPEEIFSLAIELIVSRPALSQVYSLVSVVRTAQQFLEVAISGKELIAQLDPIVVQISGCSTTSIDTKMLLFYQETLSSSKKKSADYCGAAAAITMLYMEFIFDVMENKCFHRVLAQLIDSQGSKFEVQKGFVELSDNLLQLLACAMQVQHNCNAASIIVPLGGASENISTKNLGKCISNWCLDILKSLQRLLDAPAFVSILQELIDHEHPSVRQVALQILGQRLEKLNPKRSTSEEKVLLLDLSTHLRNVIQEATPKRSLAQSNRADTIGLAQSAIMCMDVLAAYFGKSREWSAPLFDSLSEMVEFSAAINEITKQSVGDSLYTYANELKLLAASVLSCGTLMKNVGAKALPLLPTLMSILLSILEIHGAELMSNHDNDAEMDCVDVTVEGDEEQNPMAVLWQSRVLLLRSTITAIGAVVSEMHSFSHPYLQRIISLTLALHGIRKGSKNDRVVLIADVDRCLSVLASRIPPRLSSPALLQAAPNILSSGHGIARRFAQLLAETYSGLDRTAVLAHMSDLFEMVVVMLDYRILYGDDSSASIDAEVMAVETVVGVCLKLTETEMKQLLGRLGEWRDSKKRSYSQNRLQRSRCVSFYQLLAALGLKLKAIFVPCVGPFWSYALELLSKLLTHSNNASGEIQNSSKKSKKKQKLSFGTGKSIVDDETDDDGYGLQENVKVAVAVLDCIRVTCVNDESDFVNESRYLSTINTIGTLVPVRNAFTSDAEYLDFTQRCVSPCLIALASAAKRDTLWKPLVHNLLMATRHSRSIVRLASLQMIQSLFVKVCSFLV